MTYYVDFPLFNASIINYKIKQFKPDGNHYYLLVRLSRESKLEIYSIQYYLFINRMNESIIDANLARIPKSRVGGFEHIF